MMTASDVRRVAEVASQQVSWWEVHKFVSRYGLEAHTWPMLGTPSWCELSNDDPRKWCALLDAAASGAQDRGFSGGSCRGQPIHLCGRRLVASFPRVGAVKQLPRGESVG